MQPRRLRLGDILDDYCPRERRITNHAVVAMIDDQVKQTRCTTCDADHDYKQGKAPVLRRKKVAGALSAEVEGAAGPRPVLAPPSAPPDRLDATALHDDALSDETSTHSSLFEPHHDAAHADARAVAADEADAGRGDDEDLAQGEDGQSEDAQTEDDGPVHRRLIRATLPRPEGQTPERKAPDFTMRQPTGGRFNNARNGHGQRGGHRIVRGQGGQNGSGGQHVRFGGRNGGQGAGHAAMPGQQRQGGNRPGQGAGERGSRPQGQHRGQRSGGGQGRKRGR